jgi:hypothetical protein
LEDANKEWSLAGQVFNSLIKAGVRTQPATMMLRAAKKRITFYEKMKAALAAGYYIIPPFDIQLFAIRTNLVSSPDQTGPRSWAADQKARTLPVGAGRYVNPAMKRSAIDVIKEPSDDGKTRDVTIFINDDWGDVSIPVRALKPEIIEATGRALYEKIFDALGIAPAYRATDPIIAGQINKPDGKGVVTFFVAWWLDRADL